MSRFIQSVVYHKKLIGCKYMCNYLVSQIFKQIFWVSRFLLCVKNDVRGKCSALLPTVNCMSHIWFCTLTVQFSTKIAKRQKLWFWHFPRYCLYTLLGAGIFTRILLDISSLSVLLQSF